MKFNYQKYNGLEEAKMKKNPSSHTTVIVKYLLINCPKISTKLLGLQNYFYIFMVKDNCDSLEWTENGLSARM